MESTEDNKIWLFHISPSRYTYTMIFTVLSSSSHNKKNLASLSLPRENISSPWLSISHILNASPGGKTLPDFFTYIISHVS